MDDDDFPRISTGNGFQNDLIATTNDRIKKQVLVTRELHEAIKVLNISIKEFGSESASQTAKLIELTKSIKLFNKEATKQTDKLVNLTRWIVVFTVVLVVGLVVQLVAVFR
jgi:hypothetical protein